MADILEQIAEHNEMIYLSRKLEVSLSEMKDLAYAAPSKGFAFENKLKEEGMSFICECKKASPSKGIIAEDFPYLDIAKSYEAAGASCISVLTEPKWFMGSLDYLDEIASEVEIPVLRKDFTVDEYMIYEARARKASAVLLICSILDSATLGKYIRICDELELTALVEAHDKNECDMALGEGARVIGVNNRNLRDFTVDPTNCLRLRDYVGDKALFVAESGVKSREEIEVLEKAGVDAVLIGESMMRAEDKTAFLKSLKGLA
ncbi:MAG: indole-3-glycerol phosphate synthase TrpC [Clostridiales bacterium]|nr:indole-3-glycerol phosphate synthase TrpC [Clostridiales bacterium]